MRFPAFILLLVPSALYPQGHSGDAQHGIGLNAHYGFVFAHTTAVQNTAAARPLMLQAEWDLLLSDTVAWDHYRCFPQSGFLLNYTDYGISLLGKALATAYYLQPSLFISRKIKTGLRATAGASWSSNPYNGSSNPTNQSYSSHLNPYLALGLHGDYILTPHWQLTIALQYNHISNGAWSKPNKGLNWPTAGIGLRYTPKPLYIPDYHMRQPVKDKKRWRFDLAGYYSHAMISQTERTAYRVSGLLFQAVWTGRLHGWSVATEVTDDQSLKAVLTQQGKTGRNPYLSALMLGHEFNLGKFIFSQQLGTYLYRPEDYYPSFYHRWGLIYFPVKRAGIGTSLKVHGEMANFLDIRLVYAINR